LKLKLGCPIILLRNIDPASGLCNGTRLVVRGFRRNTIDAEIMVGQHGGKRRPDADAQEEEGKKRREKIL
jgi:ATP-dependent DNA helicase PIF1